MASPAPNAPQSADNSTPAASPSGPVAGPGQRPVVDVTAITTRDEFLLELGELLGGQAAVHPVESVGAALEHLTNTRRAHVLIIDGQEVADVRADLERAHAGAPQTVMLVFAAADSEAQTGTSLKGSNVFAVLPTPIDKRKTAAVLEGALSEAVARKTAPERATHAATGERPALTLEPFKPDNNAPAKAAGAGPTGSGAQNRRALMIGAGVAVAAVVAVTAWVLSHKQAASVAPTQTAPTAAAPASPSADQHAKTEAPAPVAETSLIQGKVDELLEKARLAMRERRYSEPVGDNALLYYRSAAAADAGNAEAADGLRRVAGVLSNRFEDAVTAGRVDEAAAALVNFKAAAPNDPRLASFEARLMSAQISKAFAEGNLDKATALIRQASQMPGVSAEQVARWRLETTRHQEESKVQHFATLISEHIRDGQLVDPADDSAKTYMQQLREQAPSNSTTQRLAHELNTAYIRKAREAAIANHGADVDKWLAEAKANGATASEMSAFQRDINSARSKALALESEHLAQLVRERTRDGRLSDPTQDSAAFYLAQLQTNDAGNAGIAALSRDLAGHFIDRARTEAQSGKAALADADLVQAKRWGADPKDIAAVQSIENAPKTSGPVSRTGAALGADAATLGASLKKTRSAPPDYPSKALADKVSGSVTVQFVVDTTGAPRDIRVVESTPPGVFDQAAVTAVKHWRWQSPPIEVPMRTAIRFELPK